MTVPEVPAVAVVVAAGSGSRLASPVPKALVELGGVALVRRSVDALAAGGVSEAVVTVPEGMAPEFETLLAGAAIPVTCITGGPTRQESVRLGLDALHAPDDAVVLVHDAARALVPPSVVRAVAEAIRGGAEAAVPVVALVDSVRRVRTCGSEVVDRESLRAVQTPQGARLADLRAAHAKVHAETVEVTDDAAVCEHAGHTVELVAGHRDAMKITEPVDLLLARAILETRA